MKLTLLIGALVALCQTVNAGYWTVIYEKTTRTNGEYYSIFDYYDADYTVPAPAKSAITRTCGGEFHSSVQGDLYNSFNTVGHPYIRCAPDAVAPVGTTTSLHYLRIEVFDRKMPCILLDETSLYTIYVCDLFVPLKPLPTITTTLPPATTVYAANIPASTCITGYRGKRNGRGPINACCSHNDDCNEACMKGVCSRLS